MESEINQKTEDVKVEYLRPDIEGGKITNEQDIAYYKAIQLNDIVDNAMLGSYNSRGEYYVEEEILKKLLTMPKYITSVFQNIYFCETKIGLGSTETINLKFSVSIIQDGAKSTAILKFLEKISKVNGFIENTHSFVVASYSDKSDAMFLSKVKKVFHMSSGIGGAEIETDENYTAIIDKFKLMNTSMKLGMSAFSKVEKELYEKRLSAINESDPELREELLKLFKENCMKAGTKLNPQSANYFRLLNQMMDITLEQISARAIDISKEARGLSNKKYISPNALDNLINVLRPLNADYALQIQDIISKQIEAGLKKQVTAQNSPKKISEISTGPNVNSLYNKKNNDKSKNKDKGKSKEGGKGQEGGKSKEGGKGQEQVNSGEQGKGQNNNKSTIYTHFQSENVFNKNPKPNINQYSLAEEVVGKVVNNKNSSIVVDKAVNSIKSAIVIEKAVNNVNSTKVVDYAVNNAKHNKDRNL